MAIWSAGFVQQLPAPSMVRCESCPSTIGHITLGTKQTGAPSAGNPHAGCGGWKRTHGLAIEALPEETGSNRLGPTFGIPRQSSTRPACGKVSRVPHMVPGGSRESLPKRKVRFADKPGDK